MIEIGSNLLVAHEIPETFIPKLAKQGVVNTVVYQTEINAKERFIEEQVKKELKESGVDCQF